MVNSFPILDMNSPTFAEELKEALGVKDGDSVRIMTPQFERTDGLEVPLPLIDFARLPTLSEKTLKAIGCQKWDDPDKEGNVLWLFPYQWYDYIPSGTPIISISGQQELFERGITDNDMRFGALAYGFHRKATHDE
jgi:hypothetical protein